LAKGNVTVLSPLVAGNEFIGHVRWAGTFASGNRWTMCNAHMYR